MGKEDQCLFFALGHASNQVNALWKLVIVLVNGDETDPVKQRLEGAQTQIFVRLTIGAMREAWRQALRATEIARRRRRTFSVVTCVLREMIDSYRLPPVVEFRVPRGSDIQAGCRRGSVAQGRQWCSGVP